MVRCRTKPVEKPLPPHVALAQWLARSARFQTKAAFAEAIGCTPGRLSQILGGALRGGPLAAAIERETRGEIKAVRWCEPPVGKGRAAACL